MGETAKTTAKLLPAGKSGIRRFLNADRVAVLAVVVAYAVVAILVYTGSATRQLMNMLISVSCYIVLALSLGASPEDAAALGNIIASITIQQIGVTGFATPAQAVQRYIDYYGA